MSKKILYIEIILAILSFAIYIPEKMHRNAERNNSKAVYKVDTFSEEAYDCLEKAVKLNQRNPVYHLNLGLLHTFHRNDLLTNDFLQFNCSPIPDSTIYEFEKAVAYSEKEPIPLINMVFVNAINGNETIALSILEPLLEQNFCWEPVRILYGILAERVGDFELAQKVYSDAVAQTPIILESPFYSDLKERNPLLAEAVIVSAMNSVTLEYNRKRHPLNTAVLGELEFIGGDIIRAEKHLKEALDAIPSMNRAWLFLGRIEEVKENQVSALDCYNKAVQLDEYDALPVYFKAKAEGKTSVAAEQMLNLLSLEPRLDLKRRYDATVFSIPLFVKDFVQYCSYDYVTEMEHDRYEKNVSVLNDVFSSLGSVKDSSVRYLTARIAEKMVGTPYESGLLEVYPEKLRVYLDKTDNIHFVETCLAMALTAKGVGVGRPDSLCKEPYDLLCENIRKLRYRNGIISKFSDRIFYFTEWSGQTQVLGLTKEYTSSFGHEYNQTFSYLSDHLMFLPQIGHEPKALEETVEIERNLSERNPLYVISREEMISDFYACIKDGDIVAFVSDRKGEDISRVGFINRDKSSIHFITASF